MVSKKPIPSTDFMKNIEDAIKEYGVMACPNPRCFDKLVSKKKWDRKHGKVLEYHCQNSNCAYHQKKLIPLEPETDTAPISSNRLSYNNIFTAFVVCLLGILVYTSYELYSVNQFLENEVVENREQRAALAQSANSTHLNKSNINRKPLLKSKGLPAKNTIEEIPKIDVDGFAEQTRTWVATNNFEQGKLNIEKILEDKEFKSALLLPENDLTRYQLLELVGDSYDKMGSQFSYSLLTNDADFNLLKSFIETFDVQNKYLDIYLGKAFLHLPNKLTRKVNFKERRNMQLTGLKHYLTAAKNDNFIGQKSSSIKAIYEISKAYQIFKYNPQKPKNFVTIESLLKKNKQQEIQNRIDYIDRILKK